VNPEDVQFGFLWDESRDSKVDGHADLSLNATCGLSNEKTERPENAVEST